MKPLWDNLSALFIFLTLFVGELTVQAIYDPRATTTKPPKQRELIIVPWYLSGKDFQPPSDFSQSAKWNQSKDVKGPIVARTEVKTDWSGQHKTPNFRTDDDQKNEKVDAGDNYESLEQRRDSEEIRGFTDDQNYPSQRQRISHGHRYNEEYESYENAENVRRKGLMEQPEKNIFDGERMENQDVYEDRTMFNKKPHKEKIAKVVTRPSSVVARYDSVLGVQCPYFEATGQFAHPLDCKFFVNCWNGRPFVQPCAPGTLFNPESLECDFPHKVKCYGGELSDLTAPNNLDAVKRREDLSVTKTEGRYTTANLQTPVCPAHVNGLLQHPTDCTKYLQCANGNTFIMDCGPGTVFNPAISVCDWPRNVYGCEGASNNNEEEVTTRIPPVFDHYDRTNVDVSSSPLDRIQQSAKKVKCPSDYTGLLPYPNDCKKFLQCANGVTHIMDCGPGTVFNPITTVCDWPYNVEGCDKDASKNNEGEVTTWIPPVFDHYDRTNVDVSSSPLDRIQQSAKNIKCPSDYTGLLPYPNDCKKFLQCANGVTYIMDCGPGTVFNPLTTVCDWPYNVEGCDEDETRPKQDIQPGTTAGTQWHENHHINSGNTQDSRESFSHHTDSYDHHHHGHISPERQNVDKQHGWYYQREENGQSGQTYQGRDRQTYYDQLNSSKQQNNRHQTGFNNSQHGRHDVLYGTNNGNNRYEEHKEIQHQHAWQRERTDANSGHHYQQQNYHRQQQHHVGSVTGDENGYINGSDYQRFDNKTEDVTSDETQTVVNENTRWRDHIYRGTVEMNGNTPNYHHHQHHHHHPYHHHTHGHNLNKFGGGEVPEGQNKQNGQGSENTDFSNKKFDYSRPDGNVYVDSNYQLPSESDSLNRESEYNKSLRFGQNGQFERNKTSQENWNQEEIPHTTQFGVFQPSTWGGRDQQSQGSEFEREGHTRHQEELPFPVYYIPPVQQQLRPSYKSSPITPISGQVIRLRGGSSPRSGYLEVQGAKPGWGVVCDSRNSWTLNEAHVVCRQLGYTNGAEMSWQGRTDRENISDWIAANTVYCLGNETAFQSCKFTHGQKCLVERDAIGVQCLPNRVAHCRQDELPHQGQCYHLADSNSSLNHAEALNYCALRKARLLDIVDQAENNFVSEWLVQMHPEVRSIMTSGVGFTIWNRTVFLWEDFSRAKFRYAKWWPGWMEDKKLPPWVGVRPVCVVMKRNFPCHNRPDFTCSTDYFFWDIEDCSTSMKGHSYICKRPYDDIGCIYGKGQQYSGKVNVTSSGQECLPWNDDKVAHYLAVNVASEEIREGLKGHNYCRNPNPNKEWRPWCFTGPYAEREHCDIPSCGKLDTKKSIATGQCKPEHFKCRLGECIPSPWVCDGEKDCIDGADEEACSTHLNLFEKIEKHKLEGYDVEKWLNTPVKTCALRCKEADFTCRSFSHKAENNVCLLSDSNVGLSGALESNKDFNYYEMTERSVNCEKMFVCANRKCVNHAQVCDGKNDCNDHSDEKVCTANNLGYEIRLAGSNNSYEGRVEVKVLGKWGQVCDDGFGMANANVICKELGFDLGAVEIRPGGFYGNLDPPTRFLVDQLKCRGIETSLRECDFDGWGVHNCQPSEAVGIVCKTAVNSCQDGHWKCDNSPECIPMPFICDEVVDCVDGSDENPVHCDAPFELRLVNGSSPLEGRVEVRHHGVWGTVCDDDFSNAAAIVICKSLGYGGLAVAKKNGIFGSGAGPIWLDDVFCNGNESQLYRCEHNPWGQHNCGHDEDAGVICTLGEITEQSRESISTLPEISIDDILPTNCGQREEDFDDDDNEFLAKVVRGSIAPKGSYPWQASLRVRGHSKSNHWCGAVVLSTLHVLTAAHCLEGYNKGTYFVRAGDYNNEIDEGTEIEANIEDYYIHEDFRKGHRMNNDIALVLLKGRGIPLGRNVMPICLPPENAEYSPGLNCTISGWGSIESGTSIQSRDLRYGWVPLLDQSVCRANYVYGNGAISDGMVCAGYLDEGADSCDGDSGGPLACYHNGAFTLYGVTSWGHHCGRTNKPGVYVRIAYYRRWIDRMLRESLAGR